MKILYFILVVMAACFYPMFKDDLSFLLLSGLIFFPMLMIILLVISSKKVTAEIIESSSLVTRGEPVTFKLRINNRSVLPVSCFGVYLLYRMHGSEKYEKYSVSIPLKAKSNENILVNLRPKHCGILECKIKRCRISDLIGLFSLDLKCIEIDNAVIMPVKSEYRLAVENNFSDDDSSSTYSSYKAGNDPSEVYSLRQYAEGDRQNRIHWKLSSRSSELIVKELSEPVNNQTLVIPDIYICKTDEERDRIYDIFSSLADFILKTGCSFDTADIDDEVKIKTVSSENELLDCIIEKYRQNGAFPLTELFLTEKTLYGKRYSHLIIISPREPQTVLSELEQMNIAEKISMLCTGRETDGDKRSDVMIYYTDGISLPDEFTI